MARRKKTLQEQISAEANEIRRGIAHWCYMREYGCSDPSWPDGANMNLARNNIIYGKRRLEELCTEAGVDLPEEYYLPIPPEMRLHPFLTGQKPESYPEQGAMF